MTRMDNKFEDDAVASTIVAVVLPMAYAAIDDLIDVAGDRVPKEMLIRRNSFERAKS